MKPREMAGAAASVPRKRMRRKDVATPDPQEAKYETKQENPPLNYKGWTFEEARPAGSTFTAADFGLEDFFSDVAAASSSSSSSSGAGSADQAAVIPEATPFVPERNFVIEVEESQESVIQVEESQEPEDPSGA
jgi:hypothetical protein